MKRLTMKMKLLPLAITALLLLDGCTVIGYAVGSEMEPKTYRGDEIARVERGQEVSLSLKDGTVVRGRYIRLVDNPEGGPRILILRQADRERRISVDDIRRIHKPGKKNAQRVGVQIGALLDVTVFILAGGLNLFDSDDLSEIDRILGSG
jgi:hypothetical protein